MCVGSSCLRSHNWQHGQSAMRIIKTRLREMLPDIEVFLDVDNLGTPPAMAWVIGRSVCLLLHGRYARV